MLNNILELASELCAKKSVHVEEYLLDEFIDYCHDNNIAINGGAFTESGQYFYLD